MSRFLNLASRLVDTPADNVVAFVEGKSITHAQLMTDVYGCFKQLLNRQEQYWGLYCNDSYRFIVALIALLLSRKTVLVLPNMQNGFLMDIGELQALLTDQQQDESGLTSMKLNISATKQAPIIDCQAVFPELQEMLLQIIFYTSGSTGKPKRIVKTWNQLQSEVEVLEQVWFEDMKDAVIFSTVSHQHIYGFLFRLLWPFLCGRIFESTSFQYPEPLVQQLLLNPASVIISSPAHLKRMPGLVDLNQLQGKVSKVFSSGGPLPADSAVTVYNALQVGVCEVFGSTETGGVAYRSQLKLNHEEAWKPLPKVNVRIDENTGELYIHSPFEGSGQWYHMSDLAEDIGNGSFKLRGRSDRIVKVEEKRLSLIDVEQRLLACEWVDEAAVTVLHANRSCVAVIAVLSASGNELFHSLGKLSFDRQMRDYLSRFFEAVVLPKKWRYVSKLPYNSQGKLPQNVLDEFFTAEPQAIVLVEPRVCIVEKEATNAVFELDIPEGLHYFDGHFADDPVLPGVVQLEWAAVFAERYLGVEAVYRRMEAIKFHEFIRPNDIVTLHLKMEPKKSKLYFKYESVKGLHSSGRLVVE